MTSPVSPAMIMNGRMPATGMYSVSVGSPCSPAGAQQERPRQDGHWHLPNPANVLPHVSTTQILQGLQASEELIPIVAPQLSHFTPLISIGYAGRDIYSTFNHAYKKTEKLPLEQRIKKIAADTGDVTLFHLFSTFLIPLLLAKKVGNWLMPKVKNNPRLPNAMAKHPEIITAGALTVIAVALMNPVNTLVDFLMDHTYRPLVEKRKRDKLRKEQEKLWSQYQQLKSQLPMPYPMMRGVAAAPVNKSQAAASPVRSGAGFGAAFQ